MSSEKDEGMVYRVMKGRLISDDQIQLDSQFGEQQSMSLNKWIQKYTTRLLFEMDR